MFHDLNEFHGCGMVAVYKVNEVTGELPASVSDFEIKGLVQIVPLSEKGLVRLGVNIVLVVQQMKPFYSRRMFAKLHENIEDYWTELHHPDLSVTFDFQPASEVEKITRILDSPHYIIDQILYT